MDNQNNNDAEKAIIKLGKIFKIFALVVTVLIIALCIYLALNAEPKQAAALEIYPFVNISKSTCGSFVL